jgi:hypothetical protein
MWNVITIIAFGIVVISVLLTIRFIFMRNKYNKIDKFKGKVLGNEFEFSGELNCKEKFCELEKFNSICFEVLDNDKKMLNLDKTTINNQMKLADRKLQIIYMKICKLLTLTSSDIGKEIDPKTYILFTEILKGILTLIRQEIEAVINEFPYGTASEQDYLYFRARTIESIPGMVKERIPDVHLLGDALLNVFLQRFEKSYLIDIAPLVGEMSDGIRNFAKEKVSTQVKLENEYAQIRKKYTGK